MFSAIKKRWQEARAERLLAEVDEIMLTKVPGFTPLLFQEFLKGYVGASRLIAKRHGDVINVSHRMKKEIAEELRKVARKTFDHNIGMATGIFMVSAKLEALSLPGSGALLVLTHIGVIEETLDEMMAEGDDRQINAPPYIFPLL